MTRRVVRVTAGTLLALFILYSFSALQTGEPGGPLLAGISAVLLALTVTALYRKDRHHG